MCWPIVCPCAGFAANATQLTLLVVVNALVGGLIGQQQTVLLLLAEHEFGLTGYTFVFTYIAACRATKAAANVLLGFNQGLTWSTTVVTKIDLAGPAHRGLAVGLNEAAGHAAVAVTSLFAGHLAETHGLCPAPFLLGLAYAVLALGINNRGVRETRDHAGLEAAETNRPNPDAPIPMWTNSDIFLDTSIREPALSAASQAGLVNNLNFGLSWGLFPPAVCHRGAEPDPDRDARRPLPRGMGCWAADCWCGLRQVWPQTLYCQRHGHPGRGIGGYRP